MKITLEMHEALDYLRTWARMVHADPVSLEVDIQAAKAIDTLDNANVFVPLDDAHETDKGPALDSAEWGDTTRADMARHQQES